MRFGYWMPVFGGWLRNVPDEGTGIDWPAVRQLVVDSERHGFELSLIAELNLNDIKGHRAPALDAWTLAPAVAAATSSLELMVAVRPNYHHPARTAKALSTLDVIAPGRISLNVVSSWWRTEAEQYDAPFDVHDARYERTEEWLTVLTRLLTEPTVDHQGRHYTLRGTVLEPKPASLPVVYMGGESPRAKEVISAHGTGYVMHGDPPDVIAGKITDMRRREAGQGRAGMRFGLSGFVICRDTEDQARRELDRVLDVRSTPDAYASYQDFVAGSQLESQVSLEEYSVSNRGLRTRLVGTPEQLIDRIRAYELAGVDLMLLQFSPQAAEMARFGEQVIAPYHARYGTG